MPPRLSPAPDSPESPEGAGKPAANASQTGLGDAGNGSQKGAAEMPRSLFENQQSTRNEDEVERRMMRRHFAEWE